MSLFAIPEARVRRAVREVGAAAVAMPTPEMLGLLAWGQMLLAVIAQARAVEAATEEMVTMLRREG